MAQGVFPAGPISPAPGGLFAVASVTRHSDGRTRWADGPFGWDSDLCPSGLELADFCTNAARGIITRTDGAPNASWPFGIVSSVECLTPGQTVEERRAIARKQAEAGAQKAVEYELWTGALHRASNRLTVPYLTNNTAVDVGAAKAVSVAAGVAKLEQALADCGLGTEGVLHLTRQAAQLAGSEGAVRMDSDGVLRTRLGTPVVAGTGYDPSVVPAAPAKAPVPAPVPLGARPDKQWAFATGPVHVHLGPVEDIGENLDIATNKLSVLAGRAAAVYYDGCCTAAVQLDTTL
jgi:hypothetical protein